ncbi:hypothetical protein Pelo_13390 [Pelomyxa schiedti]|nr:hypothetical protein Pelo_13390 [Pelomyxa schiedti]
MYIHGCIICGSRDHAAREKHDQLMGRTKRALVSPYDTHTTMPSAVGAEISPVGIDFHAFANSVVHLRSVGNDHFRAGRYDDALRCYLFAVSRMKALVSHPSTPVSSRCSSPVISLSPSVSLSLQCPNSEPQSTEPSCSTTTTMNVSVSDEAKVPHDTGDIRVHPIPKTSSSVTLTSNANATTPPDISRASLSILLCNVAATYIKLGDEAHALLFASRSIIYDQTNIKAWYRRACANESLGKLAAASSDLEHILEVEPNNKTARAKLTQVRALVNRREITVCRNMLSIATPTSETTTATPTGSSIFEGHEGE